MKRLFSDLEVSTGVAQPLREPDLKVGPARLRHPTCQAAAGQEHVRVLNLELTLLRVPLMWPVAYTAMMPARRFDRDPV